MPSLLLVVGLLILKSSCSNLTIQDQPSLSEKDFAGVNLTELVNLTLNAVTVRTPAATVIKNLGSLPALEKLDIFEGGVDGQALAILSKLDAPKLTNITLDNSPQLQDKGFVEGIIKSGMIGRLRSLSVDNCNLTHDSMKELSVVGAPQLQYLSIDKNRWGAEGMTYLCQAKLPKLRILFMSGVELHTNNSMKSFKTCKFDKLENLTIDGHSFSAEDIQDLFSMNLTSLVRLGMDDAPMLSGQIYFFRQAKLPNLRTLTIRRGNMGILQPQAIQFPVLPSLQQLDLTENKLNDTLLSDILNTTAAKLKDLIIKQNDIRSFQVLDVLPDTMEMLDVGGNMLRKSEFMANMSRFHSLKHLNIGDNELEDEDIAEILSYGYVLETLLLDRLPLKEQSFKALGEMNLSKLETLSLNSVPFGNRITAMKTEQKLPNLTILVLENSLIGAEGLKHISGWDMPKLQLLDLKFCHISDEALEIIGKFNIPSLTAIDFTSSLDSLTGEGFRSFPKGFFGKLETISLVNNKLSMEGVKALAALDLSNLTGLYLTNCSLTDQMVQELMKAKMPRLGICSFDHNPIGVRAVKAIVQANFTNLTQMTLGYTYIGNEGFKLFVNKYPLVKSLFVPSSNITSEFLKGCHPQFLQHIRQWLIEFNVLEDRVFSDLYELAPRLDMLQVLDIGSNDITDQGMKLFCRIDFPKLLVLSMKNLNITLKGMEAFIDRNITSLTAVLVDGELLDLNARLRFSQRVKFVIV